MPKILRFTEGSIRKAATLVVNGGLVAYPTDTVYGLGCDPFNPDSARKIVRAKNRGKGELPVLIDSVGRAAEFGRLDIDGFRLASRFWPGPLTIVIPSRIKLPDLVTGGTGKIALRIPRHKAAIELIRTCGGALVGTSANISGRSPVRDASEVSRELRNRVDLILTDETATSGVESSVVTIDNGVLRILREKSINKERIQGALAIRKRG